MNRKDLANEIRGAGQAWRFADGPVVTFSSRDKKSTRKMITRGKLRLSDQQIVEMAATCSTCEAVASPHDIRWAEDAAEDYQGFARLIWQVIEHSPACPATPYIPVYEGAKRRFAKAKAKFEIKQAKKSRKRAAKEKTKQKKSRPVSKGKSKRKKP